MNARPSRLGWMGPGLPAFAGGPGPLASAVGEYRARLGAARGTFRLLEDSRLEDPTGWIGEDGGPGYRTGLHGLVDVEEVGTIAVAGRSAPERVSAIERLARSRPDVLFLVESTREAGEDAAAPAPFPWLLRENLASIASPGELVAYLEATDFDGKVPFRVAPSARPAWLDPGAALYLQAFRRMQGLRRSLDLGTRWVLFELNDPLLWRRLEREVTAFLHRLREAGLLDRAPGDPGSEVECRPLGVGTPLEPAGEVAAATGDSGLSIRVSARLAGEWGAALERRISGELGSEDRSACLEVKT